MKQRQKIARSGRSASCFNNTPALFTQLAKSQRTLPLCDPIQTVSLPLYIYKLEPKDVNSLHKKLALFKIQPEININATISRRESGQNILRETQRGSVSFRQTTVLKYFQRRRLIVIICRLLYKYAHFDVGHKKYATSLPLRPSRVTLQISYFVM